MGGERRRKHLQPPASDRIWLGWPSNGQPGQMGLKGRGLWLMRQKVFSLPPLLREPHQLQVLRRQIGQLGAFLNECPGLLSGKSPKPKALPVKRSA